MATVWTEIAGGELRLAAPDLDEVAVPLEPADGEAAAGDRVGHRVPGDRALARGRPLAHRGPRAALPARLHARLHAPRVESAPGRPRPPRGLRRRLRAPRDLGSLARGAQRAARAAPCRWSASGPTSWCAAARPFAEDGWTDFTAGAAALRMAKPCGRCQVTTTDQSTGEVTGPEPLATLSAWRNSQEFGAMFGMNAVTAAPRGRSASATRSSCA